MNRSQLVLAQASLALIGFTSSPAFSNVLTVAPSGANYTQIQAAVAAAGQDDVILISPGSYSAVTIDGKSLTLVKQGTANVTITGTTTVKNLTASQRVILSGLKGLGPVTAPGGPEAGAGLVVTNNAGHVRVEKCAFEGAIGFGDNTTGMGGFCCGMDSGRNGAFVRNNTQGVAFIACELKGGRSASSLFQIFVCDCGGSGPGGDGLRVVSTLVSLYDCMCIGGRGGNSANGGYGGAGCRTTAESLTTGAFASGTTFQGGDGGNSWESYPVTSGGGGGSGLVVNVSTGAHLLDNTYIGGQGGFCIPDAGDNPGPPTSPGPVGPQVSGAGSIFNDPETKLVMTTDSFARAGSVVDVRIEGTPNEHMFLIVSRAPTFQILPSWRGTLLSQQGKGSVVVPIGRIPTNGVLQTRFLVPSLPAGVTSSTVFVQAVRSDMAAGPKLAAGTTITLLH